MNRPKKASPPDDARRAPIRARAVELIMRYGFSRISMDDLAKACGMSRPALYLVYKNKEDVFRDAVASVSAASLAAAQVAMEKKSTPQGKVQAVLEEGLIKTYEMLMSSPHGAEVLDLKNALAGDLIAVWRAGKIKLLARALGGGARAQTHAAIMLDAIDGLKQRTSGVKEFRDGVAAIVDLVMAAR